MLMLVLDAADRSADPPQHRHGHLRAEAGREHQRILRRIAPAAAQVQWAEVRIRLAVVGHGRHQGVLQHVDRGGGLDADAHRMPGEALGVDDQHVLGRLAKSAAQGGDLGRRASASRRRVGLVRQEQRAAGHGLPAEAEATLGGADGAVHHAGHVLGIEASPVKGAVADVGGEQLGHAAHAALAHRVLALHAEGTCAHAEDQPVAAPIEGQGDLCHAVVRGCCARSLEAGAHPLEQVVAGDRVGRDHDDAPAPAGADPVLGHGKSHASRGAGRVHRGVGSARTDVLRELAVSHGQHSEQEPPVEAIGLGGDEVAQLLAPARELVERRPIRGQPPHALERLELSEPAFVRVVAAQLLGEAVECWERAGEHHAGLVAHALGQQPAVGQLLARAGGAVGLHQRDPGVAQRIEARSHRELRGDVERLDQLGRHAVLFGQIERARPAGQLDHLRLVTDRLEVAAAVGVLDQPRDPLAQDRAPEALGHQIDQLLAAQQALHVVRRHHRLFGARQPDARACDHHRPGRHRPLVIGALTRGGLARRAEPADLAEGLREQRRKLVHGHVRLRVVSRILLGSGSELGRRLVRTLARLDERQAVPGGIQAAQRMVEALKLAGFRVIGEQRDDARVALEHVVDESLERFLGADLDEGACAGGVERAQAVAPLHRSGHLLLEQILDGALVGRVERGIDVAHHRDAWRANVEPVEHLAQGLARCSDDPCVEGVAHGQL